MAWLLLRSVFLGINVLKRIEQKPTITYYWSTYPFLGNPSIQAVLPRERFEALWRYLHLNDSELIPDHDDPQYDPLYKVRPPLQHSNNFQEQYIPGQ